MDAATRLARSREVPGNSLHILQKREPGMLESCVKRLCRARDTGVNRSHGVKPSVASLTPWRTWREAAELAQRPLRFWDTRLALAVRASLDLPRSADRRDLLPAREMSPSASSTDGIFAPSNTLGKLDRIKFARLLELAEAT